MEFRHEEMSDTWDCIGEVNPLPFALLDRDGVNGEWVASGDLDNVTAADLREIAAKLDELNGEPPMVVIPLDVAEVLLWDQDTVGDSTKIGPAIDALQAAVERAEAK